VHAKNHLYIYLCFKYLLLCRNLFVSVVLGSRYPENQGQSGKVPDNETPGVGLVIRTDFPDNKTLGGLHIRNLTFRITRRVSLSGSG